VQYDSLHDFVVGDQMAEDHSDRIRNMVFLTIPDFQITPKCIVCVSELKHEKFMHSLEYCTRSSYLQIVSADQGCCTLKFLNGIV